MAKSFRKMAILFAGMLGHGPGGFRAGEGSRRFSAVLASE